MTRYILMKISDISNKGISDIINELSIMVEEPIYEANMDVHISDNYILCEINTFGTNSTLFNAKEYTQFVRKYSY